VSAVSVKHAPSVRRALVSGGLVLAMLAFGIGVYHAAGYLKQGRPHVQRPSQTAGPSLPGTIYVVQAGAIYRLQNGKFAQITSDNGWMQPAADPSGTRLVAVSREGNASELYVLDRSGRIEAQLTHNSSPAVEANHWVFYPRFTADGSQLFYDYDPKDRYNVYRVDLSIFASPADPSSKAAVRWSFPNEYTGGDVSPLPLRGGGLIFTRFSIDEQSRVHSQIWFQAGPGTSGVALTDPEAGCLQPAVSADERLLAMVCTHGQPLTAEIAVSSWYAATHALGPAAVLARGQQVASPSFSPDGRTLAYLAPTSPGGGFQLWTVPTTESTAPTAKQITSELSLDASSAPVWIG
jgi:Tol biopolymer transport system component